MPNIIVGKTMQDNITKWYYQKPTSLLVAITNPHIKREHLKENGPKTSIVHPDPVFYGFFCTFCMLLDGMSIHLLFLVSLLPTF